MHATEEVGMIAAAAVAVAGKKMYMYPGRE